MKRLEIIQKEVETALSSLDSVERAKANPFLFTRIQARLDKRQRGGWMLVTQTISRPVFVVSMLLFVALANITVVLESPVRTTSASAVTLSQDDDQAFAREYFTDPSESAFLVTNNDQP